MTLAVTAPAWAAPSLSQYQQRELRVQNRLNATQVQYQQAELAWSTAHHKSLSLQRSLVAEANHLELVGAQVRGAQIGLKQQQASATAAEARAVRIQTHANSALVAIYQVGPVDMLDVLLGSRGFYDFLTRLTFVARIWSADVQTLRQARAAHLTAVKQAQLAAEALQRLQGLQRQAVAQEVTLKADLSRVQSTRAAEASAATQAQAAMRRLVHEKAGLEAAIQSLLAKLRAGSLTWGQLMNLIDGLAKRFGINPALVEAVIIQESGGHVHARSSAGALGLMQLMPGTAAGLGVSNPLDPVQNVTGGITYLLEMLHRFNGNLALALAAYNAGPGAVEHYGGIPPYSQTQHYVQNVLKLYQEGR